MLSNLQLDTNEYEITYETIEENHDDWESKIKTKQGAIASGIKAFKTKPEFQNECSTFQK